MGNRNKQDGDRGTSKSKLGPGGRSTQPFVVEKVAVDPTLALLFASSSGPVQAPPKSRYEQALAPAKQIDSKVSLENGVEDDSEPEGTDSEVDGDDEVLSSVSSELDYESASEKAGNDEQPSDAESGTDHLAEESKKLRKRKRPAGPDTDDIEGRYMLKLAKEEEKEEEERKAERKLKRQRLMSEQDPDMSEEEEDVNESDNDAEVLSTPKKPTSTSMPSDVPLHESLAPDKETTEIEKASRTVFLANVSTACITDKRAKKTLLEHMGSFLSSLAAPKTGTTKHEIESFRFRSTAYASTGLPKKAAFATKSLMDATTKSTNAYVVYTTAFAAREAVKQLNARMVLDRHLRVDGVAHPAKTDHRRCVFVGNLGFVDDESLMDEGKEGDRKRSKIPSDIEEGLWRQFGKAGKVESVRVVRDEKTRVGKGFAYVQFEDANSVEAALLFNEKKYPPMLPRVLRVTRAKAMAKTALASQRARPSQRQQGSGSGNPNKSAIYNPKISSQQQSLQGRANKLLGKAGAAQFRKRDGTSGDNRSRPGMEGIKTPENIVMEGYRASSRAGKPKDLKFGKGGKKTQGKPSGRGAKRASAWKKGGAKKAK